MPLYELFQIKQLNETVDLLTFYAELTINAKNALYITL